MVVRTALVVSDITVTVGVSPSPLGVPEETKISPLPESYTISCVAAAPVAIVVATLFVLSGITEMVPKESKAKISPLPESYARDPETEDIVEAGVSVEEALTKFVADNKKTAEINRTVIFQTLTFIDKFLHSITYKFAEFDFH
jgi:hypothetical protein